MQTRVAYIGPTQPLYFVLYGVLFCVCALLGTVHITRHGHIDLFWNCSGLYEFFFLLLLFVGVVLVIAPFIGLWVIGCWVYEQFSPETRRLRAEARRQKKPRNPRLEQDRIARRLAASKQRAAHRATSHASGTDTEANPSEGSAPTNKDIP